MDESKLTMEVYEGRGLQRTSADEEAGIKGGRGGGG